MSEGLNKQILKKIPYCLTTALFIYAIWSTGGNATKLDVTYFSIPLIASIILIISAIRFNNILNGPLQNFFSAMDYKAVLGKMRSVFVEQNSLLDDLDFAKNKQTIFWAVTNGVSIFVLLTAVFLATLVYTQLGLQATLVLLPIVLIYHLYDLMSAHIIEEPKAEEKFPLGFDFFETYAMKNSLRRLPVSGSVLYLLGRIIGPLVSVEVPKFTFDTLLVYETPELTSEIKNLSNEKRQNDKNNLILKHNAGESIEQLFTVSSRGHMLTALVEDSPKKLFPYLFGSEESTDQNGWTSLTVFDSNAKSVVGYIFIQKFKGVFVKRIVKTERVKSESRKTAAYQFIFIGERSSISYIKNLVEINAAKVPQSVLDIELQP
ncbi:MAG: hypothetical protein HYY22_09230 [Thaumarchaeota archaeon]|nr:hypothetical protein [Nitrososphaerota archaeon]